MNEPDNSRDLEIEPAYVGKFCWEKIEGVAVPFLIRSSNVFLAELNMLKKTLFKKHLQVLSDRVFYTACPNFNTASFLSMTLPEKDLLDEINIIHYNGYFRGRANSINSNLMRKDDAVKLYHILEVFYRIVVGKNLDNLKCGFMKTDNSKTPVPFVALEDGGLVVPIFFFECPEVKTMAFILTDHWSRSCLKLCCKLLPVKPRFYQRCDMQVIRLQELKMVIPEANQISIFRELPPEIEVKELLKKKITNNTLNEAAKKLSKSMSRTTRKRSFETTIDTDTDDASAAKILKIEKPDTAVDHTIIINDSSDDDDEFLEKKIKIEIEAATPKPDGETAKPNTDTLLNGGNALKKSKDLNNISLLRPIKTKTYKDFTDKIIARWNKIAPKVTEEFLKNIARDRPSTVLCSCNEPCTTATPGNHETMEQQAETLAQTEMMAQTSDISTHVPSILVQKSGTVIKESNTLAQTTIVTPDILTHMPFIMVQKPASVVQQANTLVNPPRTILQQPVGIVQQAGTMMLVPETMIKSSNVTAVSAGNILQQQGNVAYPNLLSQQVMQTTSVDSRSCASTINSFGLQKIISSIPHSEINATSLLMEKQPGQARILPKMDNSNPRKGDPTFKQVVKLAQPLSDTTVNKNVMESKVYAHTSNSSLLSVGVASSASNSNSIVMLPSGYAVQSGTMMQTSAGMIPNTSLIATQNSLMTPLVTPSGVLTYQNNFLGNVGNMLQIPNSGQISTNPSVVMINPNNAVGTSDCTADPNSISSFQNIIATSKGFMVYPNIIPNSTNVVTNPCSNIVTQLNNTAFHNTLMTSKNSRTKMSNQPNIILESNNIPSQKTYDITDSNNFIKNEPGQDQVDFYSNIIKTEPNKDQSEKSVVASSEADLIVPSSNTVIKTESPDYTYQNSIVPKNEIDEMDVSDIKIENNIRDVIEGNDFSSSLQCDKNAIHTIISDENMEKLVMVQNGGNEVLYKVNEIPEYEKMQRRTDYKVVRLQIQKLHTFICISKDPFNHENLLISVLEIINKLFPEISRKKFLTVAKEMDLEIFALNTSQKAALQRFYDTNNSETDVSRHLYFLYKKFIVLYATLKHVFKMIP